MLTVAIVYKDGRVWIKFHPDKFKKLLKKYYNESKSIDLALDKIVEEIKKETRTK